MTTTDCCGTRRRGPAFRPAANTVAHGRPASAPSSLPRRRLGGQRCVTPRQTCPRPNGFGRNLRSKTRWFTGFCNSHQVSHFATFFIDARAEISVAESRFDIYDRIRRAPRPHTISGAGGECQFVRCSLARFAPGFVCAAEKAATAHRRAMRGMQPPRPKRGPGHRAPRPPVCFSRVRRSFCWAGFENDPSAGSPTETLLRLLLPLNDKVQWTSRDVAGSEPPTSPRSEHFTGPFNR